VVLIKDQHPLVLIEDEQMLGFFTWHSSSLLLLGEAKHLLIKDQQFWCLSQINSDEHSQLPEQYHH